MTDQVAMSRREHRYKLAMRDHQAARGRGEDTGGVPMSMTWGWNVDKGSGQRWFAKGERGVRRETFKKIKVG